MADTFFQSAMSEVREFLESSGFEKRDPRIMELQRVVNVLIGEAWRAGRAGASLNEPVAGESR